MVQIREQDNKGTTCAPISLASGPSSSLCLLSSQPLLLNIARFSFLFTIKYMVTSCAHLLCLQQPWQQLRHVPQLKAICSSSHKIVWITVHGNALGVTFFSFCSPSSSPSLSLLAPQLLLLGNDFFLLVRHCLLQLLHKGSNVMEQRRRAMPHVGVDAIQHRY